MFIWWPPGILGATWNIDGHPVIYLVGTWRFGDKLESCWAPSLDFAGHVVFWCVPSVSFVGHVAFIVVGTQVFDWWAPGISFGGHGAFLWPPDILMDTHRYFC